MNSRTSMTIGLQSGLKTISEMSAQYDVSFRTLRFYEDKRFLAPLRVGGNRYYSPRDEIKLQLVRKGRRFGFSLTEIEQLILSQSKTQDYPEDVEPDATVGLSSGVIAHQIEVLQDRRDKIAAAIAELSARIEKTSVEAGVSVDA